MFSTTPDYGHFHCFQTDANANGMTTAAVMPGQMQAHAHQIMGGRVLAAADGHSHQLTGAPCAAQPGMGGHQHGQQQPCLPCQKKAMGR